MKVRATKTGFYESLRQVGDVFDVPDSLSAGWFVRDVIVVAAPPDVTLEQLTESVKDSAPPELGLTDSEPPALEHGEMAGHGENGAPLWEPLPEPAPEGKPENAEKTPENENVFPEKPEEVPETGKGKRK